MDYIFEEGTLERKQEEGLYDLIYRSENLYRIRERLSNDNLINQEEKIVLEKVQSLVIATILEHASILDILDRAEELIEELHKL